MRVFYDTEFLERGPRYPIALVSIGMVREDGAEYYAVNGDLRPTELLALKENPWLRENVLTHLPRKTEPLEALGWGLDAEHSDVQALNRIRTDVFHFCTEGLHGAERAELWAYYADYDHVVLSQLFGRMIDLPTGMPMYTRDIKQAADFFRVDLPKQEGVEHHALADARWVREAFGAVETRLLNADEFWIDL